MPAKKTKKTTHKRNTRKKTAKKVVKKAVRKKSTKKPIRKAQKSKVKPTLKHDELSIAELQAELKTRDAHVRKLHHKRERLIESLDEINTQLAKSTGRATAGYGGKRPQNAMNLEEAIVAVLAGKELTSPEIVKNVLALGYVSTSANFRTIVAQRLSTHPRIKRVRRGVYTTNKMKK